MTAPTTPSTFRRLAAAALLLGALSLTSCNSVEVRRDGNFDFSSVRSYAWKEDPRVAATAAEPAGEDEQRILIARVQRDVERELERRGVSKVEKGEAQVVISATLRVDTSVRQQDPNFTLYVAEEVEDGALRIEMFDRLQRKSVWVGEHGQPLRISGRATGGLVQRWVKLDTPRDWRIPELVETVLAELPVPVKSR